MAKIGKKDVSPLLKDGFNYDALELKDRQYVLTRRDQLLARIARPTSDAISFGQLFNEIKSRLPHGWFKPWLEQEFPVSRKTAYNWIDVYKLSLKFSAIDKLPIEMAALILLARHPSDEFVRQIVRRAKAGENVTQATVKEAMTALKSGDSPQQTGQLRPGQGPTPTQAGGSEGPADPSSVAPAGTNQPEAEPEEEDARPGDAAEPTPEEMAEAEEHERRAQEEARKSREAVASLPPLSDAEGRVVPPELRAAYSDPALADLCDELGGVVSMFRVEDLKARLKKLAPAFPFVKAADCRALIDSAAQSLALALDAARAGLPYAVCPVCAGRRCERCQRSGMVPQAVFNQMRSQGAEPELFAN